MTLTIHEVFRVKALPHGGKAGSVQVLVENYFERIKKFEPSSTEQVFVMRNG